MRIHTDHLTAEDLRDALKTSGLAAEGVWVDTITAHRSTKREQGWEVNLSATPGRDRNGKARRASNSGKFGAGHGKAATYDEWGYWIAEIMERDPDCIFGPYNGVSDFHEKTRSAYEPTSV